MMTDQKYTFDSAAIEMREELKRLAETVKDPDSRKSFESEMANFFNLFRRYLQDQSKGVKIVWDYVKSPKPEQVVEYSTLPECRENSILNKLVVLKLNGGLGTSMGCVGPKSIIEVRDGNTFLDLSVRQIEQLNSKYGVSVPFVLMNSFNTHDDTERIIKKFDEHNVDIITFNQSRYPRVFRDSLRPVPQHAESPIQEWYPPGHGDLFEALTNSGLLDHLISKGKEYMCVSNIDNLGAEVDLKILQHMIDSESEYIMELTNKTKADVKGGTIIDYCGNVRLLEIAQVPPAHVEEFKSIKKFRYFNTNNIWLYLPAVKRVIENNELNLELIQNTKTISMGKGESDQQVLQLETAIGSAIRFFKKARGVNVPRSRFLPVKTCSDLMLVKSDLFSLSNGSLMMSPSRFGPAPLIKLGNQFKKVSDFTVHMPSIPKIIELDHLTVQGNVYFGKGVVLKGTVIIVCSEKNEIDIPPGSILENVVVTGNLKLLEH